jgi:hypothetical protein
MGHRLFPPRFARNDEKHRYRIDQGEFFPDGRYRIVVQKNGKAHGDTLAATTVDTKVDVGMDVLDRLSSDAKARGYL